MDDVDKKILIGNLKDIMIEFKLNYIIFNHNELGTIKINEIDDKEKEIKKYEDLLSILLEEHPNKVKLMQVILYEIEKLENKIKNDEKG